MSEKLLLQQKIHNYKNRIAQATRVRHYGWEADIKHFEAELAAAESKLKELKQVSASETEAPSSKQQTFLTMQVMRQQQQQGVLLKWDDPSKRQDQ